MNRDKRFTVELIEDVASGELVCPVPEEILNDMGWYEGTELELNVEGDEIIIREVLSWSMKLSTTSTSTTSV